ncbi:amidohydrolase family protein [Asticcacaulis sp.]|uniref:amidohydrolase family protein n=1 Tax=Asticcacaulis sp. TaxID=1872648 RepID=UPI002CAA6F0F|nr:amidohydrolase family protein [Asticcacaulis sp.]HTM81527.1 amidohydrolase family protein [Asticcacaulis sp.]
MTDWIDAHHHLWKYDPDQYPWMSDRMSGLRQDHGLDMFKGVAQPLGVTGSVAVQARQIVEETDYLMHIAEHDDFVRGVVGWLPLIAPDVEEYIDRFAHRPKLKGLRHVLHDEPDAFYMLRDDFNNGVTKLKHHGLTYDLLIFPDHLPQALIFVDRHPEQVFIVDHIAKPSITTGAMEPWKTGLRDLAKRENVICKISGMMTEARWDGWSDDDFTPYLDAVLEAFRPERLMFGSDWPVMTMAGHYADWMRIVRSWSARLSGSEMNAIRISTATRIYSLGD